MRRHSRGSERLKGLKVSGSFPSGTPRYYLRQNDAKDIPLPDAPKDSPKFLKAYALALEGKKSGSARIEHRTGTIGSAIRAFMASDHFLTRATGTRATWRRFLDAFAGVFAKAKLSDLETRHIRKYLSKFGPYPANNRLKVWRALCKCSVDAGLIGSDPARDVRNRAIPLTDGHIPWTQSDANEFRKHWPIGTPQRLAFELLCHTGAAIGDAVKLGPGNVQDGWLTYKRSKSKTFCTVPFTCQWPTWFPGSRDLEECISAAPRALTYLATARGLPRSSKAAGQWFATAARAAGIDEGKTAHGVRKFLAVTMTELGATDEQRMVVLGHDTTRQTLEYSKTADAKRIISGTKFDNSVANVVKNHK